MGNTGVAQLNVTVMDVPDVSPSVSFDNGFFHDR
jgi:hypothetical protein